MYQRIETMRRLRPGGVFFLEINGTRIIHIMEHEIDFHHAYWTHRDEYLIEGQSEAVIKHHRVAMISPVELYYHLQEIGFEQLRTYNNFDARDSHPLDGNQILISVVKP